MKAGWGLSCSPTLVRSGPETYCYLDYFEREWLRPRGLEVTRLGAEWRVTTKRQTLIEYCEKNRTTPFPGLRWCTSEWKLDPLGRWAKAHNIEMQLIGIAADEAHRQKGRACPLVDRGITRQGCVKIIEAEGLSVPQKSGCYICPFQRWSQLRELRRRHPELYERAANLERLSTQRRSGETTYLRAGADMTLDEFAARMDGQGSFFDDAEMDGLLEYQPCICTL